MEHEDVMALRAAAAEGPEWRGIQQNSTQLGGEFIVGADGIVRLAHPSKEAADRPAVPELLAHPRKLYKREM